MCLKECFQDRQMSEWSVTRKVMNKSSVGKHPTVKKGEEKQKKKAFDEK